MGGVEGESAVNHFKRTAKSAAEGLGLYRLARQVNRQRAAILMYHGVTREEQSPDWAQVPLAAFEQQMGYLKEHYNVVPLRQLLGMLASGTVAPYTAAVTFDEGYRSTYELIHPVLQRLGIPATTYLTTEFVRSTPHDHRYIWTDYIAVLLESCGEPQLDLRPWGLPILDISTPERLYRARRLISLHLKALRSLDKDGVLKALEDRYGERIEHCRFARYHGLTWDEVQAMSQQGWIDFGAHTRSHPILSRIDMPRLEEEVLGSRDDIHSHLGRYVEDFAFPSGRREDISDEALALVRREFKSAATTVCRLNEADQDPYFLFRLGIGCDLGFSSFKALLSGLYSFGK